MAGRKQPEIKYDDLQVKEGLTVSRYRATWQEGALIAYAELSALQDQPARGYLLECNYRTATGREPTERQIDTGTTLTSKVRELMTGQLLLAGWREIGQDDQHRPLWQHASRIAASGAPALQVAPVADDTQIELDDFTAAPLAPGQGRPRWYHAKATQGDVQATIELFPAREYPGCYRVQKLYDRVNMYAPGTLGKKQKPRAIALLATLEARVNAALLAAGWNKRGNLWQYGNALTASSAPALQVEQDRATRTSQPAAATRTRRKKRADQAAPVAREKTLYVPAREKVKDYKRTITASDVTYTCAKCGIETTKAVFPGATPQYCDSCALEVKREKTRERVQRLRAGKKETQKVG